MRGWLIILLAVLAAFLVFGVVETEAKSYWQLKFEDARYSSPQYYTSRGRLERQRSSERRKFVPYREFQRHRDIQCYRFRGRPGYRGYYGGPYRYFRLRPQGECRVRGRRSR